jgi:hypothetical protein
MPHFKLAQLTPDQMAELQRFERDLGVVLIAWEPSGERARGAFQLADADENLVADALLDTYRTFDPIH